MNTQLFGVDPSQYLQQSADPTAANVAKMDERAKLQALNQLAGKPTTDLNFAPDVYDPTKAIGINREQMMKDIGEQQSRYNKTFTDLNQLEKYRGGAKKAIERHAEAYNLGPINNLNDLSKVMNTLNAHIHEQEKIKTGYDQPARTALQAEMAFIQDQINQVNNQLTSDYKLNDMFKTKKEVK
jgi:hypothetical protein